MFDSETGFLSIDASAWQKGIASSPFTGIADMRNMDPHSKPGALLCGRASLLASDVDLFDSFPRHAAFDEEDDILYIGTEEGDLYRRTSGGTLSAYLKTPTVANWSEADACNGMIKWKGYILFAETDKLHAFDIGSFWYDDWQTFEEGTRGAIELPHTMFVDEEDVVYITDGRWIASLAEVFGQTFDANDPATYTWNPTALDLPEGYVARSFASLGTFLVIGASYGAATNRGNSADLFPWNRTDPSFKNPLRTKGNGVWQTITQNNEVFAIVDRQTSKLYASNLTAYDLLKEIRTLSGETRSYPDAIEIIDDEILYGLGSTGVSVTGCGVYGYKKGLNHLKHTLSIGETRVEIGSITDIGDGEYVTTWTNGTTHGADLVSSFRTTAYGARMDSGLIIVGSPLNKKQFQNIDIYLARDLIEGQGVKVYWRESLDDEWTLIKTFDFATYGAVSKMNAGAEITDVTTIQLRIELTTPANSTTSPEFIGLTMN